MVFRVVEGSVTSLGSVSGTDETPVGLYEPTRAVRIFLENPGTQEQTVINSTAGGPGVQIVGGGIVGVSTDGLTVTVSASAESLTAGVSSLNTLSGSLSLAGSDGNVVSTVSPNITIQGFRPEFVTASGFIQSQIDSTVSGINDVFAVRLDDVAPTTYIGEAVPGSLETANVWRIKRMIETGPDIDITWVSGTATFDYAWTDRLTLTYN
jgi:hypothetical protein